MPIRDPDYIKVAKKNYEEKTKKMNKSKKSVKKMTQHIHDNDSNSNMEMASIDEMIRENEFEPDDVVFIEENKNYEYTLDDIRSVPSFIESREMNVPEIIKNVSSIKNNLNDDCLDAFLRIAMKSTSKYEIQSTLFCNYPGLVEPITNGVGISIIGSSNNHWRVASYENEHIKIYDSLICYNNYSVPQKDEVYLSLRFPKASEIQIQNILVQQSDGTSCGVYSAAFIVDILEKKDPANIRYSTNSEEMRNHFVKILESGILSPFPREKFSL